jgi:hypothetical protein
VQKSGAKDESSRSGTLTFNGTHASERGAAARKVEWGPALREFENFVGSSFHTGVQHVCARLFQGPQDFRKRGIPVADLTRNMTTPWKYSRRSPSHSRRRARAAIGRRRAPTVVHAYSGVGHAKNHNSLPQASSSSGHACFPHNRLRCRTATHAGREAKRQKSRAEYEG